MRNEKHRKWDLTDDECLEIYEAAVRDTGEKSRPRENQEPAPEIATLTLAQGAESFGESFQRVADHHYLPNKMKALRQESENQKAALAALKADHERLKAEVKAVNELPTLQDFRYNLQWLTQKRAAEYLRCTPRTIRNLIQKGKLTKMKSGKVQCDDKWARQLRSEYPNVRVK